MLIATHRQILKRIHEKLRDADFYWSVGYYGLILAGVVHFGFLLLFLYLKLYLLSAVNMISVVIYWYCIFGIGLKTLESRDDGRIGWLVYFELIGHNVVATYYLGTGAGFQYYIYLLAVIPFFISTYSMPVYLFRVVSALGIAITLDTSDYFQKIRVEHLAVSQSWFFWMNLTTALGALLFLFYLYIRKERAHHLALMKEYKKQKDT
jgi:hypothetical protein